MRSAAAALSFHECVDLLARGAMLVAAGFLWGTGDISGLVPIAMACAYAVVFFRLG
jgi:hypothetical protein